VDGRLAVPGGITNGRWENLYGGDGFWVFPDPADANYVYAESQGGEIGRVNRFTLEGRAIKPQTELREGKLRFNWNTPMHMSPNEKGRSTSARNSSSVPATTVNSWTASRRTSPLMIRRNRSRRIRRRYCRQFIRRDAHDDLLHQRVAARRPNHLGWNRRWNLQVTRDGAKSWTNVVGNVPNLPKASWVSWVEASLYDAGTAYATFDRHTFGDMDPHVFKTRTSGRPGRRSSVRTSGVRGYAHVIKEDTEAPICYSWARNSVCDFTGWR